MPKEQRRIDDPPEGKFITKKVYTLDADDDIETIDFYQDAELLFSLTYAYNASKNITSILRSL